ncbi:MAG: micrococcal nuclease [halophilic archaeon J07HB67]|nr:MAG: micrococcal nuclease [halophilic archaeon J07HB67]
MQRRSFLASLGVSTAAVGGIGATTTETRARSVVSRLVFESTSSLLDADGGELTDDSLITVYAEPTASNEDGDTAGDAVVYGDGTPIPLAAVDGRVGGFGSQLVTDGTNFRAGNEEFLLNVWDDLIGGGTVLYDESHDSYNSLGDFSNLANYASRRGSYTVTATQDLPADLSGADAVMITSPSTAFTSTELSALSSFASNGGVVLLHDTADYQDVDETANLDEVAAALGVGFRFNDDQVTDFDNNDGEFFAPTTTEFNWSFPYFADRPGMGIDPTTSHSVDIVEVIDGDTPVVRFDSGREISVRLVGIDTPEKASNAQFETVAEWEGIESRSYLETWANNATQFGRDELSGKQVTLEFDEAEDGIFDAFGRLLGYIRYDATGDGTRNARYNLRAVEDGYARVYDSNFDFHSEFIDAERTARADGVGLWGQSDPANTTADRNRDADDLYLPTPEAIRTDTGRLDRSRAPVVTESSATQSGGFVSYSSDVPVVGVDESSRVGAVGSPLIDYDYEAAEGYAVDTSTYENFVVLTNLIDYLSNATGRVVMDCAHGQFAGGGSLDPEDTAYYQRFLEGVGVDFESIAELTVSRLSGARALLVGAPPKSFSASELDAIQTFRDNGGAVILFGSSEAGDAGRDNLERLSYALGSDLRFNGGSVTDTTNNLNDDQTVPTTTVFDTSYPLFSAVDGAGGGDTGSIAVQSVNADAAGDEYSNLNDEYVVFENPASAGIDLTGYAVEDAAGNRYEFPSGFTLAGGATVTLRSGTGTDTDTELYWGGGSPVWNNSGDTVLVFDDTGSQVVSYSY